MNTIKDRWSALSIQQRADLIKLYTDNGITDIKVMRKDYNGIPYRDFNTSEYDYFNAHPSNAPTKEGEHWTSRNPKTGQLLKREDHPTFDLMIEKEKQAGYKIIRGYNGKLYSIPNEPTNHVEDYNSFATGGPTEELEPSIVEDYTKAIEEGEQAIQFVKDYYKSDAYKQRAKAAGLPTRNPLRNRKYKFRDDLTTNESFTRLRTNVGLQPSENAFYEYYDDIGNVAAHEYTHWNKFYNKRPLARPERSFSSPYYGNDYSRVYGFMPILEVINPINNHDAEMSESYSDLMGLRYLMQKHGIFNSMDPNAKFNEANYKFLLKDERYKNDRFLKYHTKDQVIKAINDVAFLNNDINFENLS